MSVKHTTKNNKGEPTTYDTYTRGRAIRLKCLDCCVWQSVEVRLCPSKDCPLFPYRMGSVKAGEDLEKID